MKGTTMTLKGTQTHKNLNDAFAGESQANRRYLYFARVARQAGLDDVAELFEETANGETGHAFGHLEYLDAGGAGDGPATAVATAAAGPKDGYELPWVREKRRRRAGGDASARRERVAPFF